MPKLTTTILTYAILGLAAVASFLLPATLSVPAARAVAPPAELELVGILRDFLAVHPDFATVPAAGTGHYAGNVDLTLDADQLPVFAAGGYKVNSQWRDSANRPIAPHLYNVLVGGGGGGGGGTGRLAVAGKITTGDPGTIIDGYDSSVGPYGVDGNEELPVLVSSNGTSSNIVDLSDTTITGDVSAGPGADPAVAVKTSNCTIDGTIGTLSREVFIPAPTAPTGLGPNQNDVSYIGGSFTLSDDMLCKKLVVDANAELRIDGDVVIHATNEVKVTNGSKVVLLEGASLKIYCGGDFKLENGAAFNADPGDPTRVTQYTLTPGANVKVDGGSEFHGRAYGPSKLTVSASEFYGSFIGNELTAQGAAGVHLDTADGRSPDACMGVRVDGSIELSGNAYIDGFDSSLGEYGVDGNEDLKVKNTTNSTAADAISVCGTCTINGDVLVGPGGDPAEVIDSSGTITGYTGTADEPFDLPVVVEPGDEIVGPNLGNVQFKDDPFTISENRHYDDMRVANNGTVIIAGNVTILVEGKFTTETGGSIVVLPGGSLDLYVKGKTVIKTKSEWSDPVSTRMWVIGSPEVTFETEAKFFGTVIAPDADLLVKTKSQLFGSFLGRNLTVLTDASIHVDVSGTGLDGCAAVGNGCLAVDDTAGMAGADGDGAISSPVTFGEWYQDILGNNVSKGHAVVMRPDADGVWEYLDDAFYPADDLLLGNEGLPHNYHFTYAITAVFTYEDCGGQFIEFKGGDGLWMFIGGQLVMDLGGVDSNREQHLELDRLGLSDGVEYELRLLYASRRVGAPMFRLRTNIDLATIDYAPATTMMFD